MRTLLFFNVSFVETLNDVTKKVSMQNALKIQAVILTSISVCKLCHLCFGEIEKTTSLEKADFLNDDVLCSTSLSEVL